MVEILIKGLAGGCFVVLFALIGEALKPKAFAGLFSAAPSVALAGLVVTLVAKGSTEVAAQAGGMVVGAAGFVVASLAGVETVRRLRAPRGAVAMLGVWFVATFGLWAATLR
jgi:hypothetical protein